MSLESNVRRMAGTRPFDLLPREAVQLIAFSCDRRMLKAGESLFNVGEPADAAYFVLSGELSLAVDAAERRVKVRAAAVARARDFVDQLDEKRARLFEG